MARLLYEYEKDAEDAAPPPPPTARRSDSADEISSVVSGDDSSTSSASLPRPGATYNKKTSSNNNLGEVSQESKSSDNHGVILFDNFWNGGTYPVGCLTLAQRKGGKDKKKSAVPMLNLNNLGSSGNLGANIYSARQKTARVEDSNLSNSSLFQGLDLYSVQVPGT